MFPKHYDQLAIDLLAVIGAELGEEVPHRLPASITDAQVARRLRGGSRWRAAARCANAWRS